MTVGELVGATANDMMWGLAELPQIPSLAGLPKLRVLCVFFWNWDLTV